MANGKSCKTKEQNTSKGEHMHMLMLSTMTCISPTLSKHKNTVNFSTAQYLFLISNPCQE